MKIYGIMKGIPGLGRVAAGVGLLKQLKNRGHQVKVYSYKQGLDLVNKCELTPIVDCLPIDRHITVIGLNPISRESGNLISKIVHDNPDLVILDGEPLLTSTLAMVFPREKILSLLNPTDIVNDELPVSTIRFYRYHYLRAGHAIVHSFKKENYTKIGQEYECNILSVPTILRPEILDLQREGARNPEHIVGVLGGGSNMASDGFFSSTVSIAKNIIQLARFLSNEQFVIYCNDYQVYKTVNDNLPDNATLIHNYTEPRLIYNNAKIVLCRAGRNTVSELLFLNIPSLLYATQGDFRSSEQERNINEVCKLSKGIIRKCSPDDNVEKVYTEMQHALATTNTKHNFLPGNQEVIRYIEDKFGVDNGTV